MARVHSNASAQGTAAVTAAALSAIITNGISYELWRTGIADNATARIGTMNAVAFAVGAVTGSIYYLGTDGIVMRCDQNGSSAAVIDASGVGLTNPKREYFALDVDEAAGVLFVSNGWDVVLYAYDLSTFTRTTLGSLGEFANSKIKAHPATATVYLFGQNGNAFRYGYAGGSVALPTGFPSGGGSGSVAFDDAEGLIFLRGYGSLYRHNTATGTNTLILSGLQSQDYFNGDTLAVDATAQRVYCRTTANYVTSLDYDGANVVDHTNAVAGGSASARLA